MTTSECGIMKHDAACLCDVKPLGSLVVYKNAVHDMWLGERIVECLEYTNGHEWDNDNIINYLSTLVYVHDIWVEHGGVFYPTVDDIIALDLSKLPTTLTGWKIIRNSVMAAANQYPDMPIIDILKRLDITLEQFITAVTVNKHKHVMSEDEFTRFSKVMIETEKPNYASICRMFQTGKTTMTYWKRLFRVSREKKVKQQKGILGYEKS